MNFTSVPTEYAMRLLEKAQAAGCDVAQILSELGLNEKTLRNSDELPAIKYGELYQMVMRETHNEWFGMVDKVFSSEQLNRSLKVLFVDDDVDQCHIYERIFVGRCAVEVAKNTSEARKILAANPGEIAVVVSDMRMPTESGLDFLKYVRENYPSVIRILASAYAEEDTRSALMAINDCGVHKYLQKPIAIESLRAEIKNAIELYLHNTLDTHSAQNVSSLFEEFKDSCDRWTLHNVDLSQELRALDYGLCGIISVYRTRSLNSLSREGADELMHLMDDYVDNIMIPVHLRHQEQK